MNEQNLQDGGEFDNNNAMQPEDNTKDISSRQTSPRPEVCGYIKQKYTIQTDICCRNQIIFPIFQNCNAMDLRVTQIQNPILMKMSHFRTRIPIIPPLKMKKRNFVYAPRQ